jgi:hypothetical protein
MVFQIRGTAEFLNEHQPILVGDTVSGLIDHLHRTNVGVSREATCPATKPRVLLVHTRNGQCG